MDVSIIIVNYNALKMTSECIESVRKYTSGLEYEIILVDNASTDGSREHFAAMEGIQYIYNEENLGFGRANNVGLEHAIGRNIFFLNSDTLLIENSVGILSKYIDEHPDIGALGCNLVTKDMQPSQSFHRYRPGIRMELNRLFHYFPQKIRYGNSVEYNFASKPLNVRYIIGADLMIPKKVLDLVGAFNPAFFLFFEETELCFRIDHAGYRLVCIPDSKIIHLGGASTTGTPQKNAKRQAMFEESRQKYLHLTHSRFSCSVIDFIHNLRKI